MQRDLLLRERRSEPALVKMIVLLPMSEASLVTVGVNVVVVTSSVPRGQVEVPDEGLADCVADLALQVGSLPERVEDGLDCGLVGV